MDIKRLWNYCLRMVPSLSSDFFIRLYDVFMGDGTLLVLWTVTVLQRYHVTLVLLRYMGLRANLLF